ncbi:GntR family transcriptional regulator [Nioella nitratireducens]|uniref:GntR family transcriptional regulator n=1 Tax=Nioella nitratireducens TaxID=1287720 RepID=UPI0008FD7801|nr:FCD domain-containing protein [Nioella nitratireducens]
MTDSLILPKSEIAYLRVKQDILNGRLSDDVPLRIEALKSNYDVGITPIREALARLEAEGFVKLHHNRGYYTTPLSAEDFEDLVFSRAVVEADLLKRAIERGDEEWEVGLLAAHRRLANCKLNLHDPDLTDLERWEERHIEFHMALVSAAGARHLLTFYRGIYDHFRRHQKAFVLLPSVNRVGQGDEEALLAIDELAQRISIEEHTGLMDAALSRDVELAVRLIREHSSLTPSKIGVPYFVGSQ